MAVCQLDGSVEGWSDDPVVPIVLHNLNNVFPSFFAFLEEYNPSITQLYVCFKNDLGMINGIHFRWYNYVIIMSSSSF
jgi:hypothetical protein